MSRRRTRTLATVAALGLGAVGVVVALVVWFGVVDHDGNDGAAASALPPMGSDAAGLVARGAYLARAGGCQGCHSERGGAAYAGGAPIETPFGIVHASNLTPDASTGLGAWSASDFWRALHHGRSRDGRLLYPAFPYPNYSGMTRMDADALFAFLRSLPPVARPNTPHALRFPFDQPAALAVWRALFFRPARSSEDTARGADWNRGAYLVETLGHCNACHSRRNAWGATAGPLDLAGGLIPIQNWYAPSLNDPAEAGVAGWPAADVVALLKTGIAPRGVVQGPMADVVLGSTQHLNDTDLAAMTAYLQSLPAPPKREVDPPRADTPLEAGSDAGRTLYELHCAACHGDTGRGVAGAYPALAGSRAVAMANPANLVHVVLRGGYAPATAGNPRPFGMPPFATVLGDAEVASVLSYVRGAWGNRAAAVRPLDVGRYRGAAR